VKLRIDVQPLRPGDREAWLPLARAYKRFYETPTSDEEFDQAWSRLMAGADVHGLAAKEGGAMVGIAHYLFHASAWAPKVCYLQDLFTAPQARGRGVARALIATVADYARLRGATRYYWLTQDNNQTARALYDKVAQHKGFIRYDHPL
jgi:GNAT superfamily N-acetyltransferase